MQNRVLRTLIVTTSLFASATTAQLTPIRSNATSDSLINIIQDVYTDQQIVVDDQLATTNPLTSNALASMNNEHGAFSGFTSTQIVFDGPNAGIVNSSFTIQGEQAPGAPKAGGLGHDLNCLFTYDFNLDTDGTIDFDGVFSTLGVFFDGFVRITIGTYSADDIFMGNAFQQLVANPGAFNLSTPLSATPGYYRLEILLNTNGNGTRDPDTATSSMTTNFIINTAAACPADLTGDDQLDFFDISAFLTAFTNQDPIADFNNDGVFDFFDVSSFLTAFGAGCP